MFSLINCLKSIKLDEKFFYKTWISYLNATQQEQYEQIIGCITFSFCLQLISTSTMFI